MLDRAEEELCFKCHGSEANRTREIAEGRLASGVELQDVENELRKPYHHPVREGTGHSPTERLDGARLREVTHAECVDCHDPHHRVMSERQIGYGVSGLSVSGQYREKSLFEYEICLKCHGGFAPADLSIRSLRTEFDLDVRSQHPVTRDPSGKDLPSLRSEAANRRMRCSDCHGNDDPNGPRGPHGSMNRFLLSGNYEIDVQVDESSYAFQLCYQCHDRQSILADESFPYHSMHVSGDPLTNRRGTSCFTCHASHGVAGAPNLIRFNPQAVEPESFTRRLEYRQTGPRSGECFLSCHGYDHNPGVYR
jgi:hypothetical protein